MFRVRKEQFSKYIPHRSHHFCSADHRRAFNFRFGRVPVRPLRGIPIFCLSYYLKKTQDKGKNGYSH